MSLGNFNLWAQTVQDVWEYWEDRSRISARINRVHNIAQYSQELAGAFNKFYKSVPVIDEKEDLRLVIVDKSRITIRNCLKLMGIEAPISM